MQVRRACERAGPWRIGTVAPVAHTTRPPHAKGDQEGPGHEHRDLSGGWPRAAVFGVSDGLTTNVALILGHRGAPTRRAGFVRLAGLAGLIGGAFSMAAGEWVSMRAQAELLERELALERRRAGAGRPNARRASWPPIYRGRGHRPRRPPTRWRRQVMVDPETALEVHAREEMGVNPSSLGSPVSAAVASFMHLRDRRPPAPAPVLLRPAAMAPSSPRS